MRFYRKGISDCKGCPLRDRNRVWGIGPANPSIVMLGEAPGATEDADGEPFVGKAGRLLKYTISRKSVIGKHRIYFTNIISCRPTDNNINTTEAQIAINNCKPGIEAELMKLYNAGCRVFMPLGNIPLSFFPEINETITKARGSIYTDKRYPEAVIIPTFHPSYIARAWKEEGTWVADFNKASDIIDSGWKLPKERFNIKPSVEQVVHRIDRAIKEKTLVALDIENTRTMMMDVQIVVIGLAFDEEEGLSIPFLQQGGGRYWSPKDEKTVVAALNRLLKTGNLLLQNGMHDMKYLKLAGLKVTTMRHDILLLHHAGFSDLPHNLGYINSVYGMTPYWKGEFKADRRGILAMENDKVRTYNLRDCTVLHQIFKSLHQDVEELNCISSYELNMRLTVPLISMMITGVKVDRARLKKLEKSTEAETAETYDSLREITGVSDTFNFRSDDQVRYLLYGVEPAQLKSKQAELMEYTKNARKKKDSKKYRELMATIEAFMSVTPMTLPNNVTFKKSDSGAMSLDKEALLSLQIAITNRIGAIDILVKPTKAHAIEKSELEDTIEFLRLFKEYNEKSKLLTEYKRLPIDKDGRVHTNYGIHTVKTGRISSRDPNLQNKPPEIAEVFIPDEGNVFVQADHSNLEMRVMAEASNDDVLRKTFAEGRKVHDENALIMFGLKPGDALFDEGKGACKTYIFGRGYGGSLQSIHRKVLLKAPHLNLTFARFKEADGAYRKVHANYGAWYNSIVLALSDKGPRFLLNGFGRRRDFYGRADEALRKALNYPIQSTAADVWSLGLIELYELLDKSVPDARIVLGIHDSIIVECKDESAKQVGELMKKCMERPRKVWGKLVSFPVDISIGTTLNKKSMETEAAWWEEHDAG